MCLVGPQGVGKSSLADRFLGHPFSPEPAGITATRICSKEVPLPTQRGQGPRRSTLNVWDICSEAGAKGLLRGAYFREAHGILAVYDATRPETLVELTGWVGLVREVAGDIPVVIAANKMDLPGARRNVPLDVIRSSFAEGAVCVPTSARTGEGVSQVFAAVARAMTWASPEPDSRPIPA